MSSISLLYRKHFRPLLFIYIYGFYILLSLIFSIAFIHRIYFLSVKCARILTRNYMEATKLLFLFSPWQPSICFTTFRPLHPKQLLSLCLSLHPSSVTLNLIVSVIFTAGKEHPFQKTKKLLLTK